MAMQSLKLRAAVEKTVVPESIVVELSSYIEKCYEEAKSAKDSEITDRLLKCERQRRGEYDPDKRAMINETGGSDIYMMLTDIKCRAAESWIKDVMMSAGTKSWTLTPTPDPSLPKDVQAGIVETVVMEADAVQQQGMPVDPRTIEVRLQELHEQVLNKTAEKAKTAAQKMEQRMDDKLTEAGWEDEQSDLINDFVTYPTAILCGPLIKRRKTMKWGPNWTPIVTEEIYQSFERVSPYDVFPSPGAVTCQDGYFIRKRRLKRKDLANMIGTPGYSDNAIRAAIEDFGNTGLREPSQSDSERDRLQGRSQTMSRSEDIDGIEFWGSVTGRMLIEWGMQKDINPDEEYEVNCWKFGRHVIKAVLNPDPLGRRPYSKASWEPIPGAFWGRALAEIMRDTQTMCNTAARSLANNMSIASGPQVEVSIDRLPDGESLTRMYPWKIWQTTSDRTGGGQRAINFFQPDMNAQVLLGVMQHFQKVADEVTGVPNYVYGSSNVSGAGRTASGLSMLMENAAKGIKQAILTLDRAISEMLTRLYDHLMIYDDDKSIKGDMQIVASGIVGTLMKETQMQRRNEFMQMTANPFDMQIIGPAGRAHLLREAAKGLNIDVDKVVPKPEEIMAAQQAGLEAQAAAQDPAVAQQQPQQQGVM